MCALLQACFQSVVYRHLGVRNDISGSIGQLPLLLNIHVIIMRNIFELQDRESELKSLINMTQGPLRLHSINKQSNKGFSKLFKFQLVGILYTVLHGLIGNRPVYQDLAVVQGVYPTHSFTITMIEKQSIPHKHDS